MKKITQTTKMLSVAAVCGLLASTSSFAGSVDMGMKIQASELTQNGYPYPTDLKANANHTEMANYAWRLFIASMQQSAATRTSGVGRGVGSSSMNFIDTGIYPLIPRHPLVFESLYHRTEAFPFYTDKQPPSPINQPPKNYPYYKNDKGEKVAFNYQYSGEYVNLDENNQISQNMIYYRQSHDPDFPILFMAKVNAVEAAFVRTVKNVPSKDKALVFPEGVLEVKTAWRRVRDMKNTDFNDYHLAAAQYYTVEKEGDEPKVLYDNFALIGIHIIQKTKNYPHFIFSTFEHVDATIRDKSTKKIIDPAFQLNYNNLAYDTSGAQSASPVGAYNVNAPGLPSAQNESGTYQLPAAGPVNTGYQVVEQPYTITSQVNDVNNQVNALIISECQKDPECKKNVWANYRLKGVQGIPSSQEGTFDYYLANIVIESSRPGVQLFRGGVTNPTPDGSKITFTNQRQKGNISDNVVAGQPVPQAKYIMGGCQGCHGSAQQAGQDFSFLADAVTGVGKELDAVPAANLGADAKAKINAFMMGSSNYPEKTKK